MGGPWVVPTEGRDGHSSGPSKAIEFSGQALVGCSPRSRRRVVEALLGHREQRKAEQKRYPTPEGGGNYFRPVGCRLRCPVLRFTPPPLDPHRFEPKDIT
jgi:hypothetical protein